jgi:galactose oxidase
MCRNYRAALMITLKLYRRSFFKLLITIMAIVAAVNFIAVQGDSAAVQADSMDGSTMPMIEATAADSFTPKVVNLPRTGWTAVANDQQNAYPASNVLDGNSATFWHTIYSPKASVLPHSITVDMHAFYSISSMTYLPRQDTLLNGTIGQYSITVSSDGTNWGRVIAGGTWADDNTLKSSNFPATYTRFIRLTALSEAGNRGPWSSAAEINVQGQVAADPALSRTGWTATASDQDSTNPANYVLDGNATSIWHSYYKSPATPLPHSITIDMHATKTVTGLTYLPRQDSYSNGNIGQYSITTSANGSTWSASVANGVWVDDKTTKTVTFAAVQTRYVRLTATTEAGNRGPWSSAAEINLLSPGPSVLVGGKWETPISFPLVPVSAVVLPNNKLLTFSAFDIRSFNQTTTVTKVSILDLTTEVAGQATTVDTQHQMFCTGLAILADGRVLINGGSSDSATTIYDPITNTWTQGPLMNIPRAYEATTALSTGQAFTLGGSWDNRSGNKNGEVFTPSGLTGSWGLLPNVTAANILTADPAGIYRADNHAWLFGVSNGAVFQAGPSKLMNWITTTGSGSITSAGNRSTSADAMNGNAVMYDVGKILTVGGATAYGDVAPMAVNTQATNKAYLVDITGGPTKPVVTTAISPMTYQRAFNNSVVLPDGKVLVVGGQQHPQGFTDTGAVLSPELWDPITDKFTVMAADVTPRTYHSVAALLPDGRVFSGGGGLCGSCTVNHFDGRVFTPPYLLNADGSLRMRPVLNTAPTSTTAGSTITITASSATLNFALVRTSAVTHSVNTDQRRIPLTNVTASGTTYTLSIPVDTGVVLPGTYMLFALDNNGTPSVAKFIQIR